MDCYFRASAISLLRATWIIVFGDASLPFHSIAAIHTGTKMIRGTSSAHYPARCGGFFALLAKVINVKRKLACKDPIHALAAGTVSVQRGE